MGMIEAQFKKNIIDEMKNAMNDGHASYYSFASHPIAQTGAVSVVSSSVYNSQFLPSWQMLFGKKLTTEDIVPVITRTVWKSNTVYTRYDNTSESMYANSDYYVISHPTLYDGDWNIYKCIDNNYGNVSTIDPGKWLNPRQELTFQTSDNYKWRYITTVKSKANNTFSTSEYFPVFTNNITQSTSYLYAGVEVIVVANGGKGYETWANGIVLSRNETTIQISNSIFKGNNYFSNCSIYLNTPSLTVSELKNISSYYTNTSGSFVVLESALSNVDHIVPGNTNFYISPKLIITSDGDNAPYAYTVIDPTVNSISSVTVLDVGSNITWANVELANVTGTGANLYCIAPPPGGHGYNPVAELDCKGMSISTVFIDTEGNTIPTSNIVFNKIGLIRNPNTFTLDANTSDPVPGPRYTNDTFSQISEAFITAPSIIPAPGDIILGETSKARGIVAHANSTVVYFVGDMNFVNNENITTTSNAVIGSINITTLGTVYQKDIYPLYYNNIVDSVRNDYQTESFRLIIKL
jgi:hypothetical protein